MLEPKLCYRNVRTRTGDLLLVSDGNSLLEIRFGNDKNNTNSEIPILVETEKQLKQYFAKERKTFDIPLKPIGTKFQISVWNELKKIPYGDTISYQELAKRVGDKNKSRAVGNANGKNPIPIIIPCHRVIRKNGDLGGYGGGIKIKRTLLELEKV
ncbi:MAG: methylated-DNA--[protein]-cysteine S-methyltransferase [Candidatus Cloacimonetes bacterium]|jgi:methylated-DNA-[protein]-cysteine S-methyltransferase|nr:methylated-DNA--[protein]-cysteine S-methyltransferase [Candidatus Cloacimonadota bacterium]